MKYDVEYIRNPKRWVNEKLASLGFSKEDKEIKRYFIQIEKEAEMMEKDILKEIEIVRDFCIKNKIRPDVLRPR